MIDKALGHDRSWPPGIQDLQCLGVRGRARSQQAGLARIHCTVPVHVQLTTSTLRQVIKRRHYPLSLRTLQEMMAGGGVVVDHATVHRWALKLLPVLAAVLRCRQHSVGSSWGVDETHVKVGGHWKYLYRAVDRHGQAVDLLLTPHRDVAAARRFFERAVNRHGVPEKIAID